MRRKKFRSEITGKENYFFYTKFLNDVFVVLPTNQKNDIYIYIYFTPFLANDALPRMAPKVLSRAGTLSSFSRERISINAQLYGHLFSCRHTVDYIDRFTILLSSFLTFLAMATVLPQRILKPGAL